MFRTKFESFVSWICLSVALCSGLALYEQSLAPKKFATQPLPAAELEKLIDQSPSTVEKLVFLVPSDEVVTVMKPVSVPVDTSGQPPAEYAVPSSVETQQFWSTKGDVAERASLLQRATAAGIKGETMPAPAAQANLYKDVVTKYVPITLFAAALVWAIFVYRRSRGLTQTAGGVSDGTMGEFAEDGGKTNPKQAPNSSDDVTRGVAHNKARAKLFNPRGSKRQTFADVAVEDVVIAKFMRLKNSMINQAAYALFDAKVPPGMLLIGPTGTGKTALVIALATECDFPMLMMSGSDFVEMFVGTGAARVRDTWERARNIRNSTGKPVIIFIDEVDAVAGQRGRGNSDDERERTLNQMLVEMDGTGDNTNLFVICATNHAEKLDKAFLREGRFDEKLYVDLPDLSLRRRIFAIHLKKKPVAEGLDIDFLARRCPGFSGAQIAAACNQAALLAGDRQVALQAKVPAPRPMLIPRADGKGTMEVPRPYPRLTKVTLNDLDEGITKVEIGDARQGRMSIMPLEARKQTAVHESCHLAIVKARKLYPVGKATIMPRGNALGFIQGAPENESFSRTQQQMEWEIEVLLAGRLGQKLFLKTVDTGASNDFERASAIARSMVMRLGMSDAIGAIVIENDHFGRPIAGPTLQDRIDVEVSAILKRCEDSATQILRENSKRIQRIASKLLAKETLLETEIDTLWDAEDTPARRSAT